MEKIFTQKNFCLLSVKNKKESRSSTESRKKYIILKNGIEKVLFACEWAWYRENGCLCELAEGFQKQGFEVKGIESRIYLNKLKLDSELLKKLYQEQITIFRFSKIWWKKVNYTKAYGKMNLYQEKR
jgi:hypothetical protein